MAAVVVFKAAASCWTTKIDGIHRPRCSRLMYVRTSNTGLPFPDQPFRMQGVLHALTA
jgi:hypothetical protein